MVVAANLMAMLVQYLSAKARHRHRPQTCPSCAATSSRGRSPWALWVQAELVAMATDLAEFVGAALGLNLVFGVPLWSPPG